jgi:transmembrane sensor
MMTVPTGGSGDDPLLDEALNWVVRLKGGEATRADLDAFQSWRRQSEAHEQAFKAAAGVYRQAETAAKELSAEEGSGVVPIVQRPQRLLARRAVLTGSIAAAAAYVMVRPPFGLWPSLEELSADYRTGKGERRTVAVTPDVSLELNTQTSVAVRSAPNETRVELISGEAWVAAKTSSSQPLVMLSGSGRIVASLANFDARCLDGTVTVACLEGMVTVEQGGKTKELRSTEQVTYSDRGLQLPVAIDVAQVSAWQVGQLIFRDRPLESVVDEVNRYRSGKIIITSTDLKQRLVNGTFQLDKLDNFVAQVEQLFGAKITHLPGGVVLLS